MTSPLSVVSTTPSLPASSTQLLTVNLNRSPSSRNEVVTAGARLTVSGAGGATSTYELKATGNVETSLGATKVGEYQLVGNQLIIQLTNAADIQGFSFKNA